MCANFRRSLYRTCAPPARCGMLATQTLEIFGFTWGFANACVPHHPKWDVRCVARRGDFTSNGQGRELDLAQAATEEAFLRK
eukprot:3016446-Alexandrium_andersonii.AAC.1